MRHVCVALPSELAPTITVLRLVVGTSLQGHVNIVVFLEGQQLLELLPNRQKNT